MNDDDPLIGRVIAGRYRLESRLGVGAMGSVYRARHVVIDRNAAIKILNPELLGRKSSHAWFVREARAVNRINHANIAEIHDLGETSDHRVYLVMELLEGTRLTERIAEGPMDLALTLSVIEQIASALARAHGLGVVHRDLKPEHVYLINRGGHPHFVKIIDFGLARLMNEGRLAARGSVFGTPAYMAPEQARGEDVDPRADLYALGVVFFEMLTGQHPFSSADPDDLMRCHLSVAPPDPAELRGGLDPEFSRIALKLLAKEPAQRYRDAHHVVDDCKALQRRILPAEPLYQIPHEPTPAPDSGMVRIDGVTAAALRVSLISRMAALVYPSGNGPPEVVDAVDSLWALIPDLSRFDGELEILSRWDDNLRHRSREFVAEVGRKIDELARARSETDRKLVEARRELAELTAGIESARGELEASRVLIDSDDLDEHSTRLNAALQSAAEAAARVEHGREVQTTLEARIARWMQHRMHLEHQIERFRQELDRHSARIDADLARGQPRLTTLGHERESRLEEIESTVASLLNHFQDRPACRHLLAEMDRLFSRSGDPHPGAHRESEVQCRT